MTTTYRRFSLPDGQGCYAIFYAAVHEGAAEHYTPIQRAAWAPNKDMPIDWPTRLLDQICWVAETNGQITGFFSMEANGHLDFAYVAPNFRRSKMAKTLYAHLLNDAQRLDLKHLTTEASHLARSFFLKRGWKIVTPETVTRKGVSIERFRMEIHLN